MRTEPVAIIGAVIAVLTVIQDGITHGVSPSTFLLAAVIAGLTALQRSKVYPSSSVQDVSVEAYLQGAYDAIVDSK